MPNLKRLGLKAVGVLLVVAVLVTAAVLGRGFWEASRTIFDLLGENKNLKRAISNLTAESQIGFDLEIPLGNREAKANLRRARLEYKKARKQLRDVEQGVKSEVTAAFRNVSTKFAFIPIQQGALA